MASSGGRVTGLAFIGTLVGQAGCQLTPTLEIESSGVTSSCRGHRTSVLEAVDDAGALTMDARSVSDGVGSTD